MNIVVIGLATIIVVLVSYLIYIYYAIGNAVLTKAVNLKNGGTIIQNASLNNIGISTSSYSLWVYVNQMSAATNLFQVSVSGKAPYFSLDLNTSSTLSFTATDGTGATPVLSNSKSYDITANFPTQKWVHVFINIDNNKYFDFYINGKLVKSVSYPNQITINSKTTNLAIGKNSTSDIIVAKFQRFIYIMSPDKVWSEYMKGNGIFVPPYNANITVTKNNQVVKYMSLFNSQM